MPRQAIKTSPAMARYLRECRQKSGLTLREVHELTAAEGDPIPSSTVCKIEQGKVEPGLVRVRQLLNVYHKPLHQAADLLEIEALVDGKASKGSPDERFESGMRALQEGRVREALSWLLPLRPREGQGQPVGEISQRALISISIAMQQIGKHRLAFGMVEQVLNDQSQPIPELKLHAHVQAARLWLDLGSVEIALAFLGRAREHLPKGDSQREAWILGNEANALAMGGRYVEAIACTEKALELFRETGDEINLVGSHAQLAKYRLRAGDAHGALETVRAGFKVAEGKAYEERSTRLRLIEGRALVEVGDADEGLTALKQALASAIEMDDLSLQFLSHYHLWKAHVALGSPLRAEFELGAARSHLRFSDEDCEESREVRAQLRREEKGSTP